MRTANLKRSRDQVLAVRFAFEEEVIIHLKFNVSLLLF